MAYTITQCAELLGVSTRTIYRRLEKIKIEYGIDFDKNCVIDNDKKSGTSIVITEEIYQLLCKSNKGTKQNTTKNDNSKNSQKSNSSENDIVSSLLEQLREKDKIIERLLQQNENFQVLLREQQQLTSNANPPLQITENANTSVEQNSISFHKNKKHWWNRKRQND